MINRFSFTVALIASTAIGASAASAHHPGVGGIGGAGGIFTIGAGTFSHNGGTLRFTGPAAPVDVAGSLTVWNLVLAQNNATSKTLEPAPSIRGSSLFPRSLIISG